jgi:hypothetical protein
MATYYGAQKSSAEGVLTWYEEQDQAGFIIYRHNTKGETARYEGNDKDTGGHRLARFMSEIEPSDYAIYILQLIPSSKKKDATAPSVTFQLYKKEPSMYGPGMYQMNELISKINAIQSRLDSVEKEEEEEEEEGELSGPPAEAAGPQPISFDGNFLGSIMSQPMVQQFLITQIVGFMSKVMGNNTPAPVTAVAGVETDDLEKSIELLLSKGVTPADLAKLAAMDQGQINFLLSMLRK